MKKIAKLIGRIAFVFAFVYFMIALILGVETANKSAITFIKTILSWF